MSIKLAQVLQRVYVRDPRDPEGDPIWLQGRVHNALRVIFDQANDDALHEPVHLYIGEAARRFRASVRTTRRALAEAQKLGLIKRPRNDAGRRGYGSVSERRDLATWPILVHPALLAAARSKMPFRGPHLVFPRPWEEGDFGAAKFGPANLAGKKGTGKDHYPPGRQAQGVAPSRADPPPDRPEVVGLPGPAVWGQSCPGPAAAHSSGASARGGSGSEPRAECGKRKKQQEMGVRDAFTLSSRADSMAALARFAERGRRDMAAASSFGADAPELPADAEPFWNWLVTSAAAAGWVAKEEGSWPGAKPGDLEFALQRRSKAAGQRGGTFNNQRASLALEPALHGARDALRDAWRFSHEHERRAVEPVFWPVGNHALLLIDDLKPEQLSLFNGWQGMAVIETSPGNLQVLLMAPRALRGDELLAAQRALARRAGLTCAAVQQHQPRRFPGSRNCKPGLAEPFTTRLIGVPAPGTISGAQLAELLAEDARYVAPDPAASTTAGGGAARTAKKSTAGAAGDTSAAAVRQRRQHADNSGSGQDWAWLMERLGSVRGRDHERLVEELAARAGARERQGKRTGDPDHLRYARATVDRAVAELTVRKARAAARRG